jgi:uncharacterized protein YjbJ (UPF0337 family)
MEKVTEINGSWNEAKRKLKQKFVTITASDLLLAEGNHDQIYSRLESKLGKTKDEIINLISSL